MRGIDLRSNRLLVCWVGAALAAASCDAAPPELAEPPDVILVLIDTLRADHADPQARAQTLTPNLDRLASEGVRFAAVIAPASRLDVCAELLYKLLMEISPPVGMLLS